MLFKALHLPCFLPAIMQWQNTIRTFLFVVFFSVAVAALSCAILCGEILKYYQHKQTLQAAEQSCEKLESLINDYDALLGQLENDPNLIKRAAVATLGTENTDTNAAYPKVKARQLAAARKVLTKELENSPIKNKPPMWLCRVCEPRRRRALFLAGAFLTVVSFVFFGQKRGKNQAE